MELDRGKICIRETIKTTYADLRPTDLVIDKSGKAWPIAEPFIPTPFNPDQATFWLCDPVTKIKMHLVSKPMADPVTASRIPTQADEAAKLEAEFPPMRHASDMPEIDLSEGAPPFSEQLATIRGESVVEIPMAEAVAAVEEIGDEVEAEVTAEEVDAANADTDDEPVQLPPFVDMDILQMRSHLYLLHGVYAHDMRSRQETIAMHDQAHADHDAGKLHSCYIPHVHTEVK